MGAASANGDAAGDAAGFAAPKGDAGGAAGLGAAAPNGLAGLAGAGAPKGDAAVAAAGALGFAGASSAAAGTSKTPAASFADPAPGMDLFVSNGSWKGSVFLPVTFPSPNDDGRGLGDRLRVCDTGCAASASSPSDAASRAAPLAPRGLCSTALAAREPFLPTRADATALASAPPEIVVMTDDIASTRSSSFARAERAARRKSGGETVDVARNAPSRQPRDNQDLDASFELESSISRVRDSRADSAVCS